MEEKMLALLKKMIVDWSNIYQNKYFVNKNIYWNEDPGNLSKRGLCPISSL
jgi:hypothetical protein